MKKIKIKLSKQVHLYNLPDHLDDKFKTDYMVINPLWLENQKRGRWNNPKIKKYIFGFSATLKRLSLPAAAFEYVKETLKKNDLPFKVYDTRINKPAKIRFKASLRDFQTVACKKVLKQNYGTLVAPTGAGKTIMGLYITAERKQKTLIVVHTQELAEQWTKRISSFLNVKETEVGRIGGGQFQIGTKITVALIQSVYNRIDSLKEQFGMVIADECHRAPSRMFTEALNKFNCNYRLGLTATPFRRDHLERIIFWYLGDIRHRVNKDYLIDNGYILKPQYIMRGTNFKEPKTKTGVEIDPTADYSKMLSVLTENRIRNILIVDDVAKEGRKGNFNLIVSDRKSHCEELCELFVTLYGKSAKVLTGSTPKKDRKDIIEAVNKGDIRYLFATGQLIGEGFDCSNLNNLFIASPIKFSGRIIQYVGRIMRPAPGKDKPLVYDYVDWEIPVLARSARHRIGVYGRDNIIHR